MRMVPLITANDLASLLRSGAGPLLLDARPDRAAYEESHVRGALHADLNSDLSDARQEGFDPRHGGRHPLPSIGRWSRTLGSWGIGPSTHVVIYDAADASNAASRAWWMLRAVGHQKAQVLDGGYEAAVAAGLPMAAGVETAVARAPYPADRWQLPTADIDAVEAARRSAEWKVLDVRSAVRYRGESESIDPIAGHIPGAVNLFFGENMRDGRFKSPAELREQYAKLLGGTPPGKLIVHCGSGVTACHTLLALDAAGLEGAALYVGSWSEWCRNERPREP